MKDTDRTQTVSPITRAPRKSIGKNRLLTAEEEREFGRRSIAGDLNARNELVCRNVPLVILIAKGYVSRSASFEMPDLIQEGTIGLIRAAEKFDPKRGTKFSTYAVFWIRQHIVRALDNQDQVIRIPVHISERSRAIHLATTKIAPNSGVAPSVKAIAKRLKISPKSVENTLQAMRSASRVSLDEPLNKHKGSGTATLKDVLADGNAMDPTILIEARQRLETAYVTIEKVFWTAKTMSGRNRDRNMMILKKLYEPNKKEEQISLAQVGRDLGVSREYIRQILLTTLKKVSVQGVKINWKALQEYWESIPGLEKFTGTSRRLNI